MMNPLNSPFVISHHYGIKFQRIQKGIFPRKINQIGPRLTLIKGTICQKIKQKDGKEIPIFSIVIPKNSSIGYWMNSVLT